MNRFEVSGKNSAGSLAKSAVLTASIAVALALAVSFFGMFAVRGYAGADEAPSVIALIGQLVAQRTALVTDGSVDLSGEVAVEPTGAVPSGSVGAVVSEPTDDRANRGQSVALPGAGAPGGEALSGDEASGGKALPGDGSPGDEALPDGGVPGDGASNDEALPDGGVPDDETLRQARAEARANADATSRAQLETLSTVDYASHVSTLMQNEIMMGGCELVSLGIALESMGVDADLDAIASDFLDTEGGFAYGYAGDPYWMGGGFAPGIAAAANDYLEDRGYAQRAYDLTGTSFDTLAEFVSNGYPVLVWTTMGFEDPLFTGEFEDDAEWYSNEHCVVMYGVDDEVVYVSDPLEGYVERDTQRFRDIYEQCGNRAVVLY